MNVCQNIRGPTAVNRVNYAGGGMLRLVNEGPRARWSQLGHPGCRKRARVTVLRNFDEPADDLSDNLRQSDFSLVI